MIKTDSITLLRSSRISRQCRQHRSLLCRPRRRKTLPCSSTCWAGLPPCSRPASLFPKSSACSEPAAPAGVSVVAWRLTLGGQHRLDAARRPRRQPDDHRAEPVLHDLQRLDPGSDRPRPRRCRSSPLFAPSIGLATIATTLDLTLGPIAFAIAAGLPSVLGSVDAAPRAADRAEIGGLSMPFLVLNTLQPGAVAHLGAARERAVGDLVASAMGLLMALNLSWAWLRRTGRVRARLAELHA